MKKSEFYFLIIAIFITFETIYPLCYVIAVHPQPRKDPHCMLYIGPKIVLAFSLNIRDVPILNVINFSDKNIVVDSSSINFLLKGGFSVKPPVLKIETGIKGEFMFRLYMNIKAHSSFYFELPLDKKYIPKIKSLEITIGSFIYHLEKTRPQVYDVMLERLSKIDLDAENIKEWYRKLSIPSKGKKKKVLW